MAYTSKWYLLMVASVIVIIESMRFQKQVCTLEGGTEKQTCARNTYGLITGIIGLVISFLISLFSSLGKDSALITTVAGFIMAVLYTICAGLLTFENGPATYVGNHYFSAWAGFFVSFAVFGTVLKEFLGVGAGRAAEAWRWTTYRAGREERSCRPVCARRSSEDAGRRLPSSDRRRDVAVRLWPALAAGRARRRIVGTARGRDWELHVTNCKF